MRAPDFWTSRTASATALATLLAPLGVLYGTATALRAAFAHPYRPRARVLCVGNLTAGGTGKTPIALALGRLIAARGATVCFLTRGYGGDEAALLAQVAKTIVARDRAAGGRRADEGGADVIVMDDGFQNFTLAKDLSLVIVDAQAGFGNGRLIPAGPLRESVSRGLARADAVILMGDGAPALPGFGGPVLRARLVPEGGEALIGRDVFAFAGIGRPEKFFSTLRALGARVRGTRDFPDHHAFRRQELESLRKDAEKHGAVLVTTEKDYVRIPADQRERIVPLKVHARFDQPEALAALLDRVWAKSDERPR